MVLFYDPLSKRKMMEWRKEEALSRQDWSIDSKLRAGDYMGLRRGLL